jgi:hypothetical protein
VGVRVIKYTIGNSGMKVRLHKNRDFFKKKGIGGISAFSGYVSRKLAADSQIGG